MQHREVESTFPNSGDQNLFSVCKLQIMFLKSLKSLYPNGNPN